MTAESEELYSLLIPLADERLIVPRACVAEVVRFTAPETSAEQLELQTSHAERVLELLELPFRRLQTHVVELAIEAVVSESRRVDGREGRKGVDVALTKLLELPVCDGL